MAKTPCTDGRRNNRPPVSGQFKPGICPNPQGRKAGRRNKKTIVQEAFNAKVTLTTNGTKRRVTRFEAGMHHVASAFAQGDAKGFLNGLETLKRYGLLEAEATIAVAQLTERDEPVLDHILERIRASTPLHDQTQTSGVSLEESSS